MSTEINHNNAYSVTFILISLFIFASTFQKLMDELA